MKNKDELNELILNELLQDDESFRYRLLGRLQQDCKYYLGYGNRLNKYLWAGSVEEQIETMIALYDSFDEDKKPEWITMEEIERYREEMLEGVEGVIYTADVYMNGDESKIVGKLRLIKSVGMYIITLDGTTVKTGLYCNSDEEALYEMIEYINEEMFSVKEEVTW